MIKDIYRNFDFTLAAAFIFLIVVGIVMIHSASTGESIESSGIWKKQIVWAVISLFVMTGIVLLPQKIMYAFSYVFYIAGIVLLVLTMFYGTKGGGSARWLSIGPLRFQPSEFMKIATILALARYMSIKKNRPVTFTRCIVPFIIVGIPFILVQKQPDLGTALVFGAIILPMLYWAGLGTEKMFFLVAPILSAIFTAPFIPFVNPLFWVMFMFVLLAVLYYSRYSIWGMGIILGTNISAGIAMPAIFNHLAPYRQERITTLFKPGAADPLVAGYQIIQSKIAIGSGGVFGKGFGGGSYTKLGFLPRAHTDFIFSVIGEELGFVGSMVILGVLLFIICRGILIASELKNQFTSIAAIGIATVFAFHIFVNVGMVSGIMPVTGLPLPFLSYGGSSCLTNAILVGLLLNFKLHRHEF
ncbi:rod shape-determining protein RodA [Candidatus Latescibacterota bacterium]